VRSAEAQRLPIWLAPAAALCAASLALAAVLAAVSGGRELGDDAPHLLELVRNPTLLLGPPSASLPETWRSFPPLLPPLFGLLVRPFDGLGSDFAAIRLGVLAWAIVLLAAMARLASALELSTAETRRALFALALSPSLLAATALLPQEEAYVALFVLALVGAAAAGRFGLVASLLAISVLAGKLFLAALVVPLACHAPRPLRELLRSGVAVFGAAGGWLAFQSWHYGSAPLVGYSIDPASGISAWAVLAGLGFALDAAAIRPLSGALTVVGVVAVSAGARLRGLPLVHTTVLSLLVPVLTLSIAMPPYLLWSLPLGALALASASPPTRWAGISLIFAWGGLAYVCKLLSGVALAVETIRPGGKTAIAGLVVGLLGESFPFRGARTALLTLLLALGVGLGLTIWRSGIEGTRGELDPPRQSAAAS
jgi:hypothetical protein